MDPFSSLRRLAERVTGSRIYRRLPRGLDQVHDVQTYLTGYAPEVIFDVGAYIGSFARRMHAAFPRARIHCFEPAQPAYGELVRRLGSVPKLTCHQVALGAARGRGVQTRSPAPSMTQITRSAGAAGDRPSGSVEILRLDAFCDHHEIDRVDYLKIDTEGAELDVLHGASGLLAEHGVGVIELEAGANPLNDFHAPLVDVYAYLASLEYFLFGIYEQKPEWRSGKAYLRRVNALFVSRRIA